ncbi:MAG: 4'-phosphopantetheinyl transferase superfamily protein [Tannerellaceae bacterium]|jgi:phosphopantetheinyl transferase|nr:4'-phosphopantetheinyl transferase superfamily protein [Tannerellaceae bacterium]
MPLLEIHTNPLRGIWQITEDSARMLSLLGREQFPFPGNTASEKRRREWLAVRLLLKEMAGGEASIEYHPNGAPFIPGSDYHISISHTKGYAALLLQKNASAGIDIEYRSDRAMKLKERFLSPEEYNALDKTDTLTHSLLYWSAKEVLFKMMGQENVDFREHLHIAPFPPEAKGSISASETRTENGAAFQLHYQVTPNYVWVWS